ncbi:hypothetical protein AB0C02_30825 [Micromonospora sp. NPDC048999]|uniref:hypothetical protein n=1 Tax=Micromonospora sp. NPDC048999 TaxID=3155391 RepID=UPI0033CE7879
MKRLGKDQPLSDEGGVVAVTTFACRTLVNVLLVCWLHWRLKAGVRTNAPEYLGVRLYIDWRRRVIRSVSLWTSLTGLYDMGKVQGHIRAARWAGNRGIATCGGVYRYGGDWRNLLFGKGYTSPPPLTTVPEISEREGETNSNRPPTRAKEREDVDAG